ncbi:hypothetical protein N9O61_06485 [Octadecabacter sp.]|nr:hypothetical protein [Octadecabacter sp.]
MKMNNKTVLAAAVIAIVTPAMVFAQSGERPQRAPNHAALAADLGVSEDAIKTCMPRPERAAEGETPARPDLGNVASCLQSAGSSLSVSQITTLLENNRPQRPPRQG